MVVAAPAGFSDDPSRVLRVASKYPHVAGEYFARKNRAAEVIELHGSVELAPLVGLGNVIMDIVETGTTLRENGVKCDHCGVKKRNVSINCLRKRRASLSGCSPATGWTRLLVVAAGPIFNFLLVWFIYQADFPVLVGPPGDRRRRSPQP